jgi:cation:H+ antiporter
MTIEGQLVRREIPLLLLATAAVTVMAFDGPIRGTPSVIDRSDSIILFLLFGVFIYISVIDFLRTKPTEPLLAEIDDIHLFRAPSGALLNGILAVAGCGLLYLGGELTVTNGVALAAVLEIPATVVGLFVVAVGTSMPEFVTSIIAAIRNESDLALGNVIGSNIFNALFVLPATGVIAQVPVTDKGIGDLVLSLLLAAALIPIFQFSHARLGRTSGVVLILVYLGYAAFRIHGS